MDLPLGSNWTRRAFLSAAGATGASSLASRYRPLGVRAAHSQPTRSRLYVAASQADGSGAISAFATEDHRCELLGSLPCERPAALALHPRLPVLYVANDSATWGDRPRATIQALALDPDGAPTHSLARLPLSLSALAPRSLAISADGRHLLVSAFEGGAWNSFSLDPDGMPAPNPAALKEVGSGPFLPEQAAAHPHTILPVRSGSQQQSLFVGSDYGADRLSVLESRAEPSTEANPKAIAGHEAGPAILAARHRHQLPAGSGAMHLAMHPRSGLVVAASVLRPALHTFRITQASDPALAPLQSLPLPGAPSALAFHPWANVLYVTQIAAGGATLTLWDAAAGPLQRLEEHALPANAASCLAVQPDRLWVAGAEGILGFGFGFGFALDPGSGRLTGSRLTGLGMQPFVMRGIRAMLAHHTPA